MSPVLGGNPTLVGDINGVESAMADAAAPVAYQGSQLNSSAIGTTTTAILSLPSTTYKAGRAYQVHVGGGYIMSTTTAQAFFDLWKTSTAGTQVLQFARTPIPGSTATAHLSMTSIFTVGGADVTAQLVLGTQASAAATVTHAGSALNPRFIMVRDVGPAAAYPSAPVLA